MHLRRVRPTRQLLRFAALLSFVVPAPGVAQRPDAALTVQRIFASPEFFAQGLRGARWRPGVDACTRLERSASRTPKRSSTRSSRPTGRSR